MKRPDPIRCRRPGCHRTYQPRGTHTDRSEQARAAGWRIGVRADGTPDAICPQDAKPDPELVRLCRDLDRSTRKPT